MRVLSLFDGISCGYLAFKRAGLSISQYYSSEIDKSAIIISQENIPDIIQLGDVRKIRTENLPEFDIVIGGSPCQNLSRAGDNKGLKGDKSSLFYEYLRILNELRYKNKNIFFLLENTVMASNWQNEISSLLGVQPIKIDSKLVSAQKKRASLLE